MSCHILYTHMCTLLCVWSLTMYMIIDYVYDHGLCVWSLTMCMILCVWSLTCWSQQVVEVSHDSPSWHSFLDHIDQLILNGLRSTILCALKTLTDRVAQYEQVSHSIWYIYIYMYTCAVNIITYIYDCDKYVTQILVWREKILKCYQVLRIWWLSHPRANCHMSGWIW